MIPDHQYDFLLSSHNLEHLANPIKTLHEWKRIIKPGGAMLIVLPHRTRSVFDKHRKPTTLAHMVEDYERNTGEDDMTHFEEVCRPSPTPTAEELKAEGLLRDNLHTRVIHHHAFDETNSRELLEAVGLKVHAVEAFPPMHLFLVATTPES